jgi:hypothetical protein
LEGFTLLCTTHNEIGIERVSVNHALQEVTLSFQGFTSTISPCTGLNTSKSNRVVMVAGFAISWSAYVYSTGVLHPKHIRREREIAVLSCYEYSCCTIMSQQGFPRHTGAREGGAL